MPLPLDIVLLLLMLLLAAPPLAAFRHAFPSTVPTLSRLLLQDKDAAAAVAFDALFTLRTSSPFNYIIGRRQDRRSLERSINNAQRKLAALTRRHRELDERIGRERNLLAAAELKALKHEKLGLKDAMTALAASSKELLLQRGDGDGAQATGTTAGEGTYSKVLHGTNAKTHQTVAVKLADTTHFDMLHKEFLVLQRLQNEFGFPHVHLFGRQEILNLGPSVVLVMDLLGPSVESLLFSLTLGTGGFSSATVLQVATDMLHRLQALGRHGVVHGDVHPGNILMGVTAGSNRTCHLIDFGRSTFTALAPGLDTSKIFPGAGLMSTAGSSRAVPDSDYVAGTVGFSSSETLLGRGGLEKDDLESLIYTLAYLLSGRLPAFCAAARSVREVAADKAKCSAMELLDHDSALAATRAGGLIAELLQHLRALPRDDLFSSGKPDLDALLLLADRALEAETGDCANSHSPLDWEAHGIHWSPEGIVANDFYFPSGPSLFGIE